MTVVRLTICLSLLLAWSMAWGQTRLSIAQIQGKASKSPYEGQWVHTQPVVVTAVLDEGFFVQTLPGKDDRNPATSEGLWVHAVHHQLAKGDLIRLQGMVVEFQGMTELAGQVVIEKQGSGSPLPKPVHLGAHFPEHPSFSINAWEQLEGMLVEAEKVLAVGGTDRYGQCRAVTTGTQTFREPGLPNDNQEGIPVWDGNPEIFVIAPGELSPTPKVVAGMRFGVSGPLAYRYNNYTILAATFTPPESEIETFYLPARPKAEGEISIATQNLYRFYDTIKDSDSKRETIENEDRFKLRLNKLSLLIRESLAAPDLIGVQEVEKQGVLEALCAQIALDDPNLRYRPFLLEGNDPSGIDVGFLVRDTLFVHRIYQVQKGLQYRFQNNTYPLHDRPPMFLEVAPVERPTFKLGVLGVHIKSYRGITTEEVQRRRFEQAVQLAQFLQDTQHNNPDLNLVVLGDFNALPINDGYVDVLGQLSGQFAPGKALIATSPILDPPLPNQIYKLPTSQQYSFTYLGNAQMLDHILVSAHLEPLVKGIQVARANADFPSDLQNQAGTPLRASDHDGVVLYLNISENP